MQISRCWFGRSMCTGVLFHAPLALKVTLQFVGGLDWRFGDSPWWLSRTNSLPEFMNFTLFGKTILVVNKKFRLCLANQLGK